MHMFNMSITMDQGKLDQGASIYIYILLTEGKNYHRINHRLVHILQEDWRLHEPENIRTTLRKGEMIIACFCQGADSF